MRNFNLVARGLNVAPLVHAIARQPALWDQHRLRTEHEGSPHREVSDIWIRFNALADYEASGDRAAVIDQHESVWYPAIDALPEVRPIVFDLAHLVRGERVGRVIITRLAPGARIAPHVDSGSHAAYYDRYQVALACPLGCWFRAGEERLQMQTGDVWWFDNGVEHEVVNDGREDRLAMIVDLHHSGVP